MSLRASSDEGEISDSGVQKANTSLPKSHGSPIDRHDRTRSSFSRSRSPARSAISRDRSPRRTRSRSRSPYRASRVEKRRRDEDYQEHQRDPRRFKVHYEGTKSDYRRSQISYEDIDSNSAPARAPHHDDRNYHRGSRHRTRSRSPYRSNRHGRQDQSYRSHGRQDRDSDRSRANGYRDAHGRHPRDHSVSTRDNEPLPAERSGQDAKSDEGHSKHSRSSLKVDHDSGSARGPNLISNEPELVEEPQLSEEAQIEMRRKRREALKAKYRGSATPSLHQQALHSNIQSPMTPGATHDGRSPSPNVMSPTTPGREMSPATPGALSINNDEDLANTHANTATTTVEDGPSAADYDPTMDMREDRNRENHLNEAHSHPDEVRQSIEQHVLLPAESAAELEAPKKTKDEFDMFASDDDDMFAASPVAKDVNPSENGNKNLAVAVAIPEARTLDVGMLDNWDDPEGYYKINLGELIEGRYHVQANLGQGMFSGVVRAEDRVTKRMVAIKVIRNNEVMRKAGAKEIAILERLREADPDDKKHMIVLERTFEHKGHLCMVFEALSINLREVLKKFGRDIGINLKACRSYAQQMFLGLSLMKKCNIIHADLKPDNILVNDARNVLKICDLGSASDASENEITPYLVSRFYRAPEIILGMPYDFAIDVWSIGCTLYEMYTGKILFTGRTNNQMLRSIMECRGPFTRKMLNQSQFAAMHFEDDMRFRSLEQDKVTGREIIKLMAFAKPIRDLRTRLISASKGLNPEELKELALFTDLLDRCLALNPAKRLTPNDALKHPFIFRPAKIIGAPNVVRPT